MTERDMRAHWAQDQTFSKRAPVDFTTDRLFSEATRQIKGLAASGKFSSLVEVGSGNARYLSYLSSIDLPFHSYLGSDIQNPRLEQAREDFPHLTLVAADATEMVERYSAPGTLFVAMNVLGNLTPIEVLAFFEAFEVPGTGLTFCAGGLPPGREEPYLARPKGGFNHNYPSLLAKGSLVADSMSVTYQRNAEGRATWIVTAVREAASTEISIGKPPT